MITLLALMMVSTPARAFSPEQCDNFRLDRAMCENEIRNGSRDPQRPCPADPLECNGGGGMSNCDSQRLDYAMCLNQARSSGLPDSVCGEEPNCGN